MTELLTIELKKLHFFAYHGLFPEEKNIGNEFEVNLAVSILPGSGEITDVNETVNYAKLYELLKTEMQKPRELLEMLVMEITGEIHFLYGGIKKVEIEVIKLHPPISKFSGTAGVKYSKEY
jgi:dihydroneopterin aldolase